MKRILHKLRTHTKKSAHHHISKLHTPKSLSITSASIIGSIFIIASLVFSITKNNNPHVSELAFTEHSSLGKNAGSVIPASCDTSTPPDGVMDIDGPCPTCTTYVGTGNYIDHGCPVGYSGQNVTAQDRYVCSNGSYIWGAVYQLPAWYTCTPPPPPTVDIHFQ